VDFTFRGANFRLLLNDNTTEQALLLNGEYNEGELDFLSEGLASGGVFVDVGANIGLFTLPLALKASRVLAIEADPLIEQRLAANLAANAFDNVTVAAVAVGDHTGQVSFIRDAENLGHNRVGEGGQVTVPIRLLLDVVREAGIERIDAFKIDVEGFEDKVLDPFFATAPRALWPRRVVIEKLHAGPGHDTPVDRMMALGYRKHGGNRANLFLTLEE